jgi:uracil-DNA glycosylase family protein
MTSGPARPGGQPAATLGAADASGPPASPRRRAKALIDLEARERTCTNCDLFKRATQVVPGRGPLTARLVLVGEQPGDQEDRVGEPFVGPAGGVLAKALARAGIERGSVFVTNAVKHFKWEPRGKRRIHQKPRWSEIHACRPWLDAELALIAAPVIVALGATAAQALLGNGFRMTAALGSIQSGPGGRAVIATYHPSAVLRATGADRQRLFDQLATDLRRALGASRVPTRSTPARGAGRSAR